MQTLLKKLNIDVPVAGHHSVASVVHVVVEAIGEYGLFRCRPNGSAKVLLTKKLVHRSSGDLGEKFTLRVRPVICVARLQQQRPWCDEGDEHIRIHRRSIWEAAPLRVIRGELVWVARGRSEMRDCLTVIAMAQRRAAFTRAACDHCGEALIVRACPHYSLPQARHAMNRNASSVDTLVSFEVVFDAAHAPGPRRNGSPCIRRAILFSAARACIDCANAVAEAIQIVGVDITVVEGGDSDTGVEKRLYVQASQAAGRRRRSAGVRLRIPDRLRLYAGILNGVLHGTEVDAEKHGNWLIDACRQVHKQLNRWAGVVRCEIDHHLLADGFPIERGSYLVENIEGFGWRSARCLPILLGLENGDDFRTAFLDPRLRVSHWFPVV